MPRTAKLYHDPAAKRLWRRCGHDRDVRWLLEAVLSPRHPEVGRTLLLASHDVFGQLSIPAGRKLSLLFRLTGFPYLSVGLKEIARSLRTMMGAGTTSSRRRESDRAIADWTRDNGREAQHRLAAALLETVRRNPQLRALVSSDDSITAPRVAQTVADFDSLDLSALGELVDVLGPFLARKASKRQINRFTLNFAALLPYFDPQLTQWDVVRRSAIHFVTLLRQRDVTESGWRELLLKLIDRNLVVPTTSVFFWCRMFPADGFVASAPNALPALPPLCPSCGEDAHAMACFGPARGYHDAVSLKDGLLGAAIGWHLRKRRIDFHHGLSDSGTEFDFIAAVPQGHVLIECKMFGVSSSAKQLGRAVREAARQVSDHGALLTGAGWKLHASVCVVNLVATDLAALRRKGLLPIPAGRSVVSYEEFRPWLSAQIKP